jgi:hypothetical protein
MAVDLTTFDQVELNLHSACYQLLASQRNPDGTEEIAFAIRRRMSHTGCSKVSSR